MMSGNVGPHSNSTGPHLHFQLGGLLPRQLKMLRRSRRPERVLSPEQTEAFEWMVKNLGENGGI